MPHRCGIFTVRPKNPLSIVAEDRKLEPLDSIRCIYSLGLTVTKYCEDRLSKIEPLLEDKKQLSDSDMEKFGQKDPESYPNTFRYL